MMSLQPGDIIWIEFRHVETNRVAARPALIVSKPTLGPSATLAWVLMITSAANASWASDIIIENHEAAGLPVPSVIRVEKIATLDMASAHLVGRLPEKEWSQVRDAIAGVLNIQ